MRSTLKKLPLLAASLWTLAMLVALVPSAYAGTLPAGAQAGQVKVMTQNLYVGADIFRILDAETPEEIPVVVAEILGTVFDTDFNLRAQLLADEIAARRPDLVGLQEVSLLRVQSPGDFLFGNPQSAETVLFDYLDLLLDALAERGLDYRAAAVVENADIELPVLVGFDGPVPLLDDIRLTDRDVILALDSVATENAEGHNFNVVITIPVAGLDVDFLRGYTAVDATVRNRTYHFVNTHLEVGSPVPLVQAAQAQELLAELAVEPLPVIVVGDLNSAPEDPLGQPYSQFVGAGFSDAWLLRTGPLDPGFTCCQSETLDNPMSLLDERIDHIFVRSNVGEDVLGAPPVGPLRAVTVTGSRTDELAAELWPSDHAGVFSRLVIRSLKP